MRRPTPCRSFSAFSWTAGAVLLGTTLFLTAPEAAAAAKASAKTTVVKASAKATPPKKPATAAAAARKPSPPPGHKTLAAKPAARSPVRTAAAHGAKAKPLAVRGGKLVARSAPPARGRTFAAAGHAPALYRTASATTSAAAPERRVVSLIEEEESLIDVLVRENVATDDLIAAVDAFEDFEERAPLGRGDRIELVLGERNDAGELALAAVRIARGQGGDVTLVRAADGTFTVAGGTAGTAAVMVTMTGTVGAGWRGALAAADVPGDVADEVDRLLALDLDMPRPVPRGATFEILAERRMSATGPAHAVRYVGVSVAGHDHRIYRYMPPDGPAGYFDEAGRSIAPLSLALPIADGKLTSDYGWRRHPKLRKRMFHRGIDLAAPIGTPILASADGIVEVAGWRGAYGRYVRIGHGNGVSTGYGHLREYASTVVVGSSVRQGEVIGYLGSSGRSTGPHVDFSVLVDGRPVNPLQALMPTPRDLSGPELVAFREHVAQVQGQARATP